MLILVIDDEKDLRETLKSMLELEGYDVITAENGFIGLMMAQEKKPDLILLDISMPVMDGFTALFKLKQNPATREIPVIILTGQYVDEENLEKGFNLGAIEYLYKPIRFAELVSRVKSVLRMRALEIEAKKIEIMTEKFFMAELKELFNSIGRIVESLIASGEINNDELKSLLLDNYVEIKKRLELIEYFTSLGNIYAGVEDVKTTVFDFNLLIRDVSEEVRKEFSLVDFEIGVARDALIKGNQDLLRMGFKVLFGAMAEAMGFKGKIYISQSTKTSGEGKFLFVTVQDEARKLPSEILKFLFNPPLLLDYEYKPDYNLLAMKVFQRVIEVNHGLVVAEPSELQVGNKFIIRFNSV